MKKNEEIQTVDDKEAAKLCLEVGILEELQKNPGMGFKMVTRFGHPTHFVMGCRFSGHEDQQENGLVFMALPKSRWTPTMAIGYIQWLIAGQNLENVTRNEVKFGPQVRTNN